MLEFFGTQPLRPADVASALEHPVKPLKPRGHLPCDPVLKVTRRQGLPPLEGQFPEVPA